MQYLRTQHDCRGSERVVASSGFDGNVGLTNRDLSELSLGSQGLHGQAGMFWSISFSS